MNQLPCLLRQTSAQRPAGALADYFLLHGQTFLADFFGAGHPEKTLHEESINGQRSLIELLFDGRVKMWTVCYLSSSDVQKRRLSVGFPSPDGVFGIKVVGCDASDRDASCEVVFAATGLPWMARTCLAGWPVVGSVLARFGSLWRVDFCDCMPHRNGLGDEIIERSSVADSYVWRSSRRFLRVPQPGVLRSPWLLPHELNVAMRGASFADFLHEGSPDFLTAFSSEVAALQGLSDAALELIRGQS